VQPARFRRVDLSLPSIAKQTDGRIRSWWYERFLPAGNPVVRKEASRVHLD
jgi:hypothetical protein